MTPWMNEAQLVEYNRDLDEANTRTEAGEFISQEDLEKVGRPALSSGKIKRAGYIND